MPMKFKDSTFEQTLWKLLGADSLLARDTVRMNNSVIYVLYFATVYDMKIFSDRLKFACNRITLQTLGVMKLLS